MSTPEQPADEPKKVPEKEPVKEPLVAAPIPPVPVAATEPAAADSTRSVPATLASEQAKPSAIFARRPTPNNRCGGFLGEVLPWRAARRPSDSVAGCGCGCKAKTPEFPGSCDGHSI